MIGSSIRSNDVADTALGNKENCVEWLKNTLAWKPGEHREIRVINHLKSDSAVISSPEDAVTAIKDVAYGAGVYVTINPIAPDSAVIGSVEGRLLPAQRGKCTNDLDIMRRVAFVIDLDPVRDADTSATNEQLAEARDLARTIVEKLHAEGWPMPTEVCSGNGVHLYFRIDIEGGSDLPQRALRGLHERFGSATVKVDTGVGNASRIMRIPGTWNAKGSDRSLHRMCTLEVGGENRLLTREQLEAVALQPIESSRTTADPGISTGSFDVPAWLEQHGVKHRGQEPWPGGGAGAHRWVLDVCAFNPAHNRGEAVITQQANGAIGFTCHHDSCSEHGWKEFRKVIESVRRARADSPAAHRMAYPVDALPVLLQDLVRAQASASRVDEASVAVPAMTALLGVIGNSVEVEVWPEWTEPMVAWTALVALSGAMKSATIGLAEKTLINLENGFPPPLPDHKRERLVVTDVTVEALSEIAAQNPRGLVLYRDELAGHMRAIGQYKKVSGADEAFWLSAYEGKRHTVDRKSTGSTIVRRVLISVLGSIQPTVLREVMTERSRCESGFAARFWFVQPERRLIVTKKPPPELTSHVKTIRTRLCLCMESLRKIPMPEGEPATLRCSDLAAERLEQFANHHEEVAYGLPDSSVERSCRSKARGWAAKVAGLVALLRCYEAQQGGDPAQPDYSSLTIEEPDVEAAIRLIDWQIAENARVLRTFTTDAIDQRLKHRDGLAREALDQTKRVVTCTEYRRRHGVSKEEAEAVLDELVTAKLWARRFSKPAQTGGRPVAEYLPLGEDSVR